LYERSRRMGQQSLAMTAVAETDYRMRRCWRRLGLHSTLVAKGPGIGVNSKAALKA
jgi:hypothetical protein